MITLSPRDPFPEPGWVMSQSKAGVDILSGILPPAAEQICSPTGILRPPRSRSAASLSSALSPPVDGLINQQVRAGHNGRQESTSLKPEASQILGHDRVFVCVDILSGPSLIQWRLVEASLQFDTPTSARTHGFRAIPCRVGALIRS